MTVKDGSSAPKWPRNAVRSIFRLMHRLKNWEQTVPLFGTECPVLVPFPMEQWYPWTVRHIIFQRFSQVCVTERDREKERKRERRREPKEKE